MLQRLLIAWCLMALCVCVHAAGVTSALRWISERATAPSRFMRFMGVFVGLAGWMVVLHLVEICAWAVYYFWAGAMPDLDSAIYFSAVTYTTTGYGDLVLPPEWRLLGAVEALTGILMCGWSTGFFFAVVSRIYTARASGAAPDRLSSPTEGSATMTP